MKYKKNYIVFVLFFFVLSFCFSVSARFYSEGSPKSGEFAITYDDGPGFITDKLLDLLKKHNVKVSFFILGENAKKYPDKVRRIYNEGHLIGSHTYSHKNFFIIDKKNNKNKEEIFKKELLKTEEIFSELGIPKPKYLRLPYGFSKKWALNLAQEMGYTVVNWSYGIDWQNISEEKMIQGYLKSLKSGAIFLLHDGGGKNREKTLKITQEILKMALSSGLKPVRIDELLEKKDYEFKRNK